MFFTKSKTGNNKSRINILKRFKEFFLIRSDAARSEKKLKDCISTIQKLALRKKTVDWHRMQKKAFFIESLSASLAPTASVLTFPVTRNLTERLVLVAYACPNRIY